jgi:phosphohistidine phosphatase
MMTGVNGQSLYLLRHARAQPWQPDTDDFARPLIRAGVDHMALLAQWMGGALQPPLAVLCSPSRRTRDTFRLVASAWPGDRLAARFPAAIYETTAGGLHALAGAAFDTADRVLLIGHNPALENLVMQIAQSAGKNAPGRMASGTLAVVDFARGWRAEGGKGQLRHWIRRRDLPPATARHQGSIDSR